MHDRAIVIGLPVSLADISGVAVVMGACTAFLSWCRYCSPVPRSCTAFRVLIAFPYCVHCTAFPVLRSCTAGATQEFNGSPSIGGDIVYVGSNDRYLHAIDRKTGAFKFKFLTCANVFSSAAVSDAGMVYIGCNTETGG